MPDHDTEARSDAQPIDHDQRAVSLFMLAREQSPNPDDIGIALACMAGLFERLERAEAALCAHLGCTREEMDLSFELGDEPGSDADPSRFAADVLAGHDKILSQCREPDCVDGSVHEEGHVSLCWSRDHDSERGGS